MRKGFSKVITKVCYGFTGFSYKVVVSMGKETMAVGNHMLTHVGEGRKTNGVFFITNLKSLSKIRFLF